jgi:hypothetical protein
MKNGYVATNFAADFFAASNRLPKHEMSSKLASIPSVTPGPVEEASVRPQRLISIPFMLLRGVSTVGVTVAAMVQIYFFWPAAHPALHLDHRHLLQLALPLLRTIFLWR